MERMKQEQVISMLQFDTKAFRLEYLKILEEELNEVKTNWEKDVKDKLGHPYFSKHAKAWGEVDRKINHIILHLKANTFALADTYGTGSLMTSDNPGLDEYMNSKYWNPARHGKTIVGRKSREYTNLFGQKRSSKGAYEGDPIENKVIYNEGGKKYAIAPSHPSLAIKIANLYVKRNAEIAIKNATKRMNFGKFLKEVK